MEEREQQFTNVQFEISQLKSQLTLIHDELEGKDITIAKLANESAFLKQEITRLNE